MSTNDQLRAAGELYCPTCFETEPHTGTCGTSDTDTRAWCKRATLSAAAPTAAQAADLMPLPAIQQIIDIVARIKGGAEHWEGGWSATVPCCDDAILRLQAVSAMWARRNADYENVVKQCAALASKAAAEPVVPAIFQSRIRPMWRSPGDGWTDWEDCTAAQAADYERTPVLHDWQYEVRRLYLAAPAQPKAPTGLAEQLTTAVESITTGHDPFCMSVLRGKDCSCGLAAPPAAQEAAPGEAVTVPSKKLKALQDEAARYRWLKQQDMVFCYDIEYNPKFATIRATGDRNVKGHFAGDVDAAIDKARAALSHKGGRGQ